MQPYIRLTYGELLRLFRSKKKYKIKEVAAIMGVTSETIKNYESSITIPSYVKMKKFEDLYGDEFKVLSEYLMSKHEKKKRMSPTSIRLESPHCIFHGSFDDIERKTKPLALY